MKKGITIQCKVQFAKGKCGRKRMKMATPGRSAPTVPVGRVPRISRLMALAIRFDELIRGGEVTDYAELARLGHVTRARVTQIMNLLNLAPDIQEHLLFLPPVTQGRDPVKEWQVRPTTSATSWHTQRESWKKLNNTIKIQVCNASTPCQCG
jgi:hypothetical protein